MKKNNVFYQPENALVGDVIPFFEDDTFKGYYLKNWRSDYTGPKEFGWHRIQSKDFIHFDEECHHIRGGTGSVIKVDGIYHLFYCIFPGGTQLICHATSPDLRSWTTHKEETFGADGVIYSKSDWRDPFVFYNSEEGQYWMLTAAQTTQATDRRGCVGLCVSHDLSHWEYRPPFYANRTHQSALECPDYFMLGEWHYLVYSAYTDRFQTFYRMSRNINGPWTTPDVDTFDTRAFYAAKTCYDGRQQLIFGWNPTREYNHWGFNPANHATPDCSTWDWGGTMEIHRLVQLHNGSLGVAPLEQVLSCYKTPCKITMQQLTGDWTRTQDGIMVDSPTAFSALLLGEVGEETMLEMDVTLDHIPRQFGIAVRTDSGFSRSGGFFCIEPLQDRVQYKTGIRMYEDGGKMFPSEIEMERPIKWDVGSHHLCLMVQGTQLLMYLDDRVALSTRLYDHQGENFGIFVSEGAAHFSKIRQYRPTVE